MSVYKKQQVETWFVKVEKCLANDLVSLAKVVFPCVPPHPLHLCVQVAPEAAVCPRGELLSVMTPDPSFYSSISILPSMAVQNGTVPF